MKIRKVKSFLLSLLIVCTIFAVPAFAINPSVIIVAEDCASGDYSEVCKDGPSEAIDYIVNNGGSSAENPYLIKVLPGTFEIAYNGLHMQPYTVIEGAGENVTKIVPSWDVNQPLIKAAENTAVRSLTIETPNSSYSSIAVKVEAGETLSMENVNIISYKRSNGIYNLGGDLSLRHVVIKITFQLAQPTADIKGIYNWDGKVYANDVSIDVSGNSSLSSGLNNSGEGSVEILNSTISASGALYSYGVDIDQPSTAVIKNSSIVGSDYSLIVGGAADVAYSQLIGSVSRVGYGTLRCIGNYDDSLQPLTCP